ncbi:uncharacterized protein AMSG_03994 [Thecamonas trahens ATCC 50062]|uniref:Rhodanese domain-containing protein n=1 Tax=Thecamonas trahens ATCC 50062 TaxID=461836 RepID=A0A0L0D5V8_THETB|nr:hypothetical protein AMSG_03994 [Thecamonas trahens ATCC 50062]KNC47767.1 hypothetical protein AMSG_03994 [Thecamonas trahens ATCC 50062]|eukprot:XP_013759245.1 hypothetical protein AMSG_03994 [Thecamonas trahens ATCC 50062]
MIKTFLFLAVLLSVALAQCPSTNDICACISTTNCGFCAGSNGGAANGGCRVGSSSGPNGSTCATPSTWYFSGSGNIDSQCSAAAGCAGNAAQSCQCAEAPGCGFCGSSGGGAPCVGGTTAGPFNSAFLCPGGTQWTTGPQSQCKVAKAKAFAGIIAGVAAVVLLFVFILVWWCIRGKYWWRSTSHKRCCCDEKAACNGCCCFRPYEPQPPPHFDSEKSRKARAVRVAPCFPHNPVGTCSNLDAQLEDDELAKWEEAHPCGCGCGLRCAWIPGCCCFKCPAKCMQCCEDQVDGEPGGGKPGKAAKKEKKKGGTAAPYGLAAADDAAASPGFGSNARKLEEAHALLSDDEAALGIGCRAVLVQDSLLGDIVGASLVLRLLDVPAAALAAPPSVLARLLDAADGVLVVFAADDPDSLLAVDRWRLVVEAAFASLADPPRIMLVANKTDCPAALVDQDVLNAYVMDGGYYGWAATAAVPGSYNSVELAVNQLLAVMYEHADRRAAKITSGAAAASASPSPSPSARARNHLAINEPEAKVRRLRKKRAKRLRDTIKDFYAKLEADLEAVGVHVEGSEHRATLEALQKQRALEVVRLLGALRPESLQPGALPTDHALLRTQYLFSLRVAKWENLLVHMVTGLSVELSGLSTAQYSAAAAATILDNVSVSSGSSVSSSASSLFSWSGSSAGGSSTLPAGAALPLNLVAPDGRASFDGLASLFTPDGQPLVPGATDVSLQATSAPPPTPAAPEPSQPQTQPKRKSRRSGASSSRRPKQTSAAPAFGFRFRTR